MERTEECPFCERISSESPRGIGTAAYFRDAFPVTDGHTLVVPRRHVTDIFELTRQEQSDLWETVIEVRARLAEETQAEGFNVGFNAGAAAGQTVGHAHAHVIPRRIGDIEDPRGGIRWVIPARAKYWET